MNIRYLLVSNHLFELISIGCNLRSGFGCGGCTHRESSFSFSANWWQWKSLKTTKCQQLTAASILSCPVLYYTQYEEDELIGCSAQLLLLLLSQSSSVWLWLLLLWWVKYELQIEEWIIRICICVVVWMWVVFGQRYSSMGIWRTTGLL